MGAPPRGRNQRVVPASLPLALSVRGRSLTGRTEVLADDAQP